KLTRGDEAANLRARRRVAEVAVEAMDQNARKLIKRLIAEAQRIFGPDDRETLSLRRLAEEYGQNGTVAALEQALAEHERVPGRLARSGAGVPVRRSVPGGGCGRGAGVRAYRRPRSPQRAGRAVRARGAAGRRGTTDGGPGRRGERGPPGRVGRRARRVVRLG